jgi:hypothetical protein
VRALTLAIAVALTACTHVAPPPPCADCQVDPVPGYTEDPVADGLGTLPGYACRSLRANGCAEGFRDVRTNRTCFQRLTSHAEIVTVPYECVASAKSEGAVRKCGTRETLRFRCRMPSVDDPN